MRVDGGVIRILMTFSIDSHLHVLDIQIENQQSHDQALRYSKIDVASIRNFVVNLNKMLSSTQVVDGPDKIFFSESEMTELLVLLRFGTFPFEEKATFGVTSGQQWMEWSAFPFF